MPAQVEGAVREFMRLAQKKNTIPKTQTNTVIVLDEKEKIPMKELWDFEHMLSRNETDVENVVMTVAPHYPYLAELLTDARMYRKFVKQTQFKKWKNALGIMSQHPNEKLRAIALLLFLRHAHAKKKN